MAALFQHTLTMPSLSRGWDEFFSYYNSYPRLNQPMSTSYELSRQACAIYLTRFSIGPEPPALHNMVDEFQRTMATLPANSPCQHMVVWSVFIAGFESSTREHQNFFADFLTRHHQCNGFLNTVRALDYLRMKWDGSRYHDWIHGLTDLNVFVV